MPLSKRMIRESFRVAERRIDTSNAMAEEYDVEFPGSGALWLPEDDCVVPMSVEIDLPWHQDVLDLNYPKATDTLYQFPIVREYPPGYVTVYTHHFEFVLHFPMDSFFVKDPECFQCLLSPTNSLSGSQFDCLYLDYPLFGLSENFDY